MRTDTTAETQPGPKRKLVAAKITDQDNGLLDRACRRLRITRSEAVLGHNILRIIAQQRDIEAAQPPE